MPLIIAQLMHYSLCQNLWHPTALGVMDACASYMVWFLPQSHTIQRIEAQLAAGAPDAIECCIF